MSKEEEELEGLVGWMKGGAGAGLRGHEILRNIERGPLVAGGENGTEHQIYYHR